MRLSRVSRRRRAAFSTSGLLGVVMFVSAAFWFTLPNPKVWTTFKGEVERVRVVVANPDVAAFRVGRMRLLPDGAGVPRCVSGLVIPAAGTEIIYQRVEKDRLAIGLTPSATRTGPTAQLIERSRDGLTRSTAEEGPFNLVADRDCSEGEDTRRLPIHGEAEFGRELLPASPDRDVATGYLFEGSLVMFGQSIDRVFGWLPVSPSLYQVEELTLPAGSRVLADPALPSAVRRSPTTWWGVARIDADGRGLSVEASTSSRLILAVVPGTESGSTTIRIGDFTQWTKDPNIYWAFIGLGFLATTIVATIIQLWFGYLVADDRKPPLKAAPGGVNDGPMPRSSGSVVLSPRATVSRETT